MTGVQFYESLNTTSGYNKKQINDMFAAAGYDGFTHVGGGRYIAGDSNRHRVYIALEANQAKSVFNSGEFSYTTADLLNQFDGLATTADRRQPAYEQLRDMWDKMDDQDRREAFMWLTERTLVDPLSGVETLVAKALGEKPEGWIEATSDLNALTAINNTWGHDAGDTLISGIGNIASEETKKVGGRVFRVGGDEFTYWFPDEETARKAMQAIDERVSESVFTVGGKRRKGFTVSYGIAEDHTLADKALYADKQRRVALGQRPLVRDQLPESVLALNKTNASNLQSYLGRFGLKDENKVIAIFNGADFSTLPHELGHMFRTELPEADLRIIEKATGIGEGDFDFLRGRFAEYNRALDGNISAEALNMSRSEYDTYFKSLKADANKYEKAEEMFADGFVKYLKTGQAPIPELQSAFDKFKAWLREIWNAFKKNADLSMKLDADVRGVYDRLFQVPFGETVPPVRYSSLGEVPHDIAAQAFKSQASQQIVDNMDAAFNVWKLRYDLKGIPEPALKNFATAKAFVREQFDNTTGDLANQYRILQWRFEQFENEMMTSMERGGFLQKLDSTVDQFFAPSISEYHMDDGVKTFMRAGVHNRTIYEQMSAGLQEWRNFLMNAAENGTPFPLLVKEEADNLRSWAVGATERKAKLMDLAINGGKYGGISVEGALPKTNRFMLDYQDRNNFDQMMKNVFPFWMFPSRSLPFWAKTLATNPRIVMLYQKMRKMSEASRYQAGAVTSQGKPLPSLENYIPIPGLDLWINPSAPLSFRYLLDIQSYGDNLIYKARTAQEDDQSAYSFIATQFMETSPVFGFSPGPWVQFAAQKLGVPTSQWSLIPQTNLIPPWWLPEFIQRSETMMNWISPEPKWHDFLVERDMLEEATKYVRDTKLTDTEKKAYLAKVGQAISEKGDNPLWKESLKSFVTNEKKNNVMAFFTGFYPKQFSDSQADLLQARNEYVMRASAMNNNFQANLLNIPLEEQMRWDDFRTQYRVDTPLGWLYHLYGDIGWVEDATGRLVEDPTQRAKLVAGSIDEDNKARSYFAAAQDLERWKNEQMSALPIGANYDQTREILDKYYAKLNLLEAQLMPPYKYYGSNKPVNLIKKDIRNYWWKKVTSSRPSWNPNEDYATYQERMAVWERNFPVYTPIFVKHFIRSPQITSYMGNLDTDQPLNLDALVKDLVAETSVAGYEAWKLENDDIFTALNTVWKENYWNPYWDAVGPYKDEQRDLLEMRFFDHNPVPDVNKLYNWIVQKYGPDRFTMDDIQQWVMYNPSKELEIYNIDDRHLQDVGEIAVTREKIWNVLSWAGPGKQREVLQNAFVDIGGSPDDLAHWYEVPHGLAWDDDPAHVTDFYNKLSEAAQAIQLRPPNRGQLEQFLRARQENNILNSLLAEELGNDYQDVLNVYFFKSSNLSKPDFRKWKHDNRDAATLVNKYFKMRDVFGYSHKLWASYYQWKPKPKPTNLGPMNANDAPLTNPEPRLPQEKKADEVMKTLGGQAQPLTFSFGAPWPVDMKSNVSSSLVREIESAYRGYSNLSSSARNYLNSLYRYHPEWRGFIARILSLK
jgi:GGDEF domain-containing protein